MSWISELHKKSIDTKKKVALLISGIVTGIIFVSWFMIWRTVQSPQIRIPGGNESSTSTVGPIKAMTEVFSDGYNSFKEQFMDGEDLFDEIGEKLESITSIGSSSSSTVEVSSTTATTTPTTDIR